MSALSAVPRVAAALLALMPTAVLAQPAAIVVDTDRLVAQARGIAREAENAAREWERTARDQVRRIEEQLRDLELDFGTMAFAQRELGGRTEIVKNAPYTAAAISESVQVLSDGNRIVRQSRTLLARDGHGRTRQEQTAASGASTIYVFDPIDGRSFVLNPERRTAMRIPRVPLPPIPPVPPVPGIGGVPPVPPVPPVPAPGVAPTGSPGMPGTPAVAAAARPPARIAGEPDRIVVRGRDDVRVEVVRVGRGEWPAFATPHALTLPLLPRGKGETRSLGTRVFEGVTADGTQTTHTIAAGEIGNEKPIVVTSERWFSPELHVVVFARTVDPRVGETSYRLANIRREEPPADLFRIPSDYRTRGMR